jgi:hypothetical protein
MQAQLKDTSDIVRRHTAADYLPVTEIAIKRRALSAMPIEQLLQLPLCYTQESFCGRLITARYVAAVAAAAQRSADAAESTQAMPAARVRLGVGTAAKRTTREIRCVLRAHVQRTAASVRL